MRHKRPAEVSIGIDVDSDVIGRWERFEERDCLLVCADAIDWLRRQEFVGDELIYCDPPYVPSTRRSERVYRHDYDISKHVELLDVLRAVGCKVMLSGYSSELYEDELSDWASVSFRSKTHAGVRTETLWMNFEPPQRLHDYSCLGENFRQRELIKRRLGRLKSRIDMLTAAERAHLAEWLADQMQQPRAR